MTEIDDAATLATVLDAQRVIRLGRYIRALAERRRGKDGRAPTEPRGLGG